jgi:hypothetical protein
MTDETGKAWQCPKDGMVMQPLGRRSGAWRCATCKGIFMDTRGHAARATPDVVAGADERGPTESASRAHAPKRTRPGAMPGLVEMSVR